MIETSNHRRDVSCSSCILLTSPRFRHTCSLSVFKSFLSFVLSFIFPFHLVLFLSFCFFFFWGIRFLSLFHRFFSFSSRSSISLLVSPSVRSFFFPSLSFSCDDASVSPFPYFILILSSLLHTHHSQKTLLTKEVVRPSFLFCDVFSCIARGPRSFFHSSFFLSFSESGLQLATFRR